MVEPPSLPSILMSLLLVVFRIRKLPLSFDNRPNSVPLPFNTISCPPASNLMSSAASIVKSPVPLSDKVTVLSNTIEPDIPNEPVKSCMSDC